MFLFLSRVIVRNWVDGAVFIFGHVRSLPHFYCGHSSITLGLFNLDEPAVH